MEKTYTIQPIKHKSDVSKGQKIVAAMYLVTNHLSDTDPFKQAIRTRAIELTHSGDRSVIVDQIGVLLGAAALARVISEKNAAIISREISLYAVGSGAHTEDAVSALFETEHKPLSLMKRTEHAPRMSFINTDVSIRSKKQEDIHDNKNKRQSHILSFINDRKSVSIKDISALFTDVSEKTIQRELGALVVSGQITKRGSKRWSIYMALPASQ